MSKKKKKQRPPNRPNLSYYELIMPAHTFLKHRNPHCRGTILLPVSSRDSGQVIGRAYCRRCGAVVGRKALKTIWRSVDRGSCVPQLLPAPDGGQGLGFRHHKVSPIEALEASLELPQAPAQAAPARPRTSPQAGPAKPKVRNLWGKTLDVAMGAAFQEANRKWGTLKTLKKVVWDG